MTGPSSEHTPRPGATWQTELVRTEQLADDDAPDPTVPRDTTSAERARLAETLDQPTPTAATDDAVTTCICSDGYECPHRCWHCGADRTAGCAPWCHIRPFDPTTAAAATQATDASCSPAAPGTQPNNPPGSTSEQLPAHILALIDVPAYTSTACETARECERVVDVHATERPWLIAHAEELHDRCRLNHKFTGALCICPCHQEQPAG